MVQRLPEGHHVDPADPRADGELERRSDVAPLKRMEPLDETLFDPPASPMPNLALPFAVLGAAAGWLSAGFIANPITLWGYEGLNAPAALCGALVTGIMGRLLTRWGRPKRMFDRVDIGRVRLALLVAAGGTLTGGLTAAILVPYNGSGRDGALLGLLCALPFIPICALVLEAARRAERARMGSIVAAADRREVWSILMSCVPVAALAGVPDWISFARGQTSPPAGAILMILGAAVFTAALLVANKKAVAQVARVMEGMEAPGDDAGIEAGASVPKVDLGLGDDLFARLSRQAAAYRSRDRAVALVVGSPAQATEALRRAMRKNKLGLAICAGALLCHGATALRSSQTEEKPAMYWMSRQVGEFSSRR